MYFRMIGTMQHQDSGAASREHGPASKGVTYFRRDSGHRMTLPNGFAIN